MSSSPFPTYRGGSIRSMEEGATAAQTWLEEAVAGDGGLHSADLQSYVNNVWSN